MSVLGSKRILLVAISVLIVAAYFVSSHRSVAKVEYSLPEKSTWWIAPSMLATKWGHFADERVDIKDQYWPTGKRALQAVLDQQADIGYAAGPPVAITIHSGKPLLVLAQAMSSRRIVHLLPRIGHAHDWYEHPIGLARGTISEFYLISHLKKIGKFDLYRNGKMTLVDRQRVEANFITLLENTTKSIILFEPFASVVTMGDPASRQYTSITDPSVYKVNCFILTTPAKWKEKRAEILRALAAIRRASNDVVADPQRAWRDVLPLLEYSQEAEVWGKRDWANVDFNLITDRKRVLEALRQDGSIGTEAGVINAEPNFDPALSVMDEVDQYLRSRGL